MSTEPRPEPGGAARLRQAPAARYGDTEASERMGVGEAIRDAEAILPGRAAPDGEIDPRWQAVIHVATFIETDPRDVWVFADRWGRHEDSDLRAAIATCVVEHLLEHHFDLVFPWAQQAVRESTAFADTFGMCGAFGQSLEPGNADRFDALKAEAHDR